MFSKTVNSRWFNIITVRREKNVVLEENITIQLFFSSFTFALSFSNYWRNKGLLYLLILADVDFLNAASD